VRLLTAQTSVRLILLSHPQSQLHTQEFTASRHQRELLINFNSLGEMIIYHCNFDEQKISAMNRIKAVLEERGIKQTWLAEKLGKSYNMVNSYVQNRRQPSIGDLYKIGEILKIEAKDLLVESSKAKS